MFHLRLQTIPNILHKKPTWNQYSNFKESLDQ